jgi:SGT1 protein
LDLFSLEHHPHHHQQQQQEEQQQQLVDELLLYLAALADQCNMYMQSQPFLWHYGCDGPVFGICTSNNVPHLRAYCRYGPNVLDEWMGISMLMEITKRHPTIAARAWDVQDGQVILIQLAELLPENFDQDPTDRHIYAAWLVQGKLRILEEPQHITLGTALQHLRQIVAFSSSSFPPSYPHLQEALVYWLQLNQEEATTTSLQRTPLVLPRNVAKFFKTYPRLLHTAIQAFCTYLELPQSPVTTTTKSKTTNQNRTTEEMIMNLTKYEDWVWTTECISRTNYAMIQTMNNPEWPNLDTFPINSLLLPVEVKRMQRTCRMDSATHIKHAVAMGIRIMVGWELLLQNSSRISNSKPLPSLQDRILYWNRIEQEIGMNINHSILEAYQQGPNQSILDLKHILTCPVFPEERFNVTVWTAPEISLPSLLQQGLKQVAKEKDAESITTIPPKPDQVDSDDWMNKMMRKTGVSSIQTTDDLDHLLTKFQSFVNQTSGVEGVVTHPSTNNKDEEMMGPVTIQPRVFLNILHAVLKGDELNFPPIEEDSRDPFFYDDDYDAVMPVDGNDNDMEDSNNNDQDTNELPALQDIMTAMDQELQDHRNRSMEEEEEIETMERPPTLNAEESSNMQVLNNLLQSLEASGGGSGPVMNILNGME